MNLYIRNFNIRILHKVKGEPLFSTEGSSFLDIVSDVSLLNRNGPSILADPFLFVHHDELFLFYEHQDKFIGGKGRICMKKTKDLRTWTDEVTVLEEPFHLSFPNVFEEDGIIYMLPETGGGKYIGLYEAQDGTLEHWKLKKKLIEDDVPWYDSYIYKKDGVYYLFTSRDDDIEQEQHLFIANNLFGPYQEHPCSPIAKGRDCGRNAGSLITYNGELFRPVQVCLNSYGEQTSMMKIETISPTEYKESVYTKNIFNTSDPIYKEGGHQFNPVEFNGRIVVATDYRVKNYNVFEFFRKVKSKL